MIHVVIVGIIAGLAALTINCWQAGIMTVGSLVSIAGIISLCIVLLAAPYIRRSR